MVRKAHDEPRIQNWRSGVAGASKWSVTILAGTASIWRPYMPITTQNILMKSSGSTRAMVMEEGDLSLRGTSKRDARSRSTPSGSVRGSAAGGQVAKRNEPAELRETRSEGCSQRNDALLMLCA
jgi:hypothetical protein